MKGYALPLAAASAADLLAAVSLGLPLAARGFLGRAPAALAPFCALCATRKA